MKKIQKKENGITLIALVLTIIILLILAGVSIAMLTGENGILSQAQRVKSETENAQVDEKNVLDNYKNYITLSTGEIIGGEWNEEKGVNTPALKENMKLVRYENGEWIEDESGINYSYVAGKGTADNNSSEWANAKVIVDGVESYFVWIPRYEYKIDSNTRTIDVRFIPTTKTEADEGFTIHPAFTANLDNGGWISELSGIWIGKYESSRVDATGESEGADNKIKVQPGVISFRNETIGNMYAYAKAYAATLNSHMLKNSEWGAVAYLTHSQYGRNGHEITINNSSKCITGSAGNSVSAAADEETTNDYASPQGVLASSTGNEYGIYDLSGGTNEYVATFYTKGNLELINNGIQLVNEVDSRYKTELSEEITNVSYKIGDASYETNKWNNDGNFFFGFSSTHPFIKRGGDYTSSLNSGVFCFNASEGISDMGKDSFRLCLVIK